MNPPQTTTDEKGRLDRENLLGERVCASRLREAPGERPEAQRREQGDRAVQCEGEDGAGTGGDEGDPGQRQDPAADDGADPDSGGAPQAEVARLLATRGGASRAGPLGGRRDHSLLRARLLGSLYRSSAPEIDFARIMPATARADQVRYAERERRALVRDEMPGRVKVEFVRRAAEYDLVVLGIQRRGRRRRAFGELPLRLARETDRPLILISRRN